MTRSLPLLTSVVLVVFVCAVVFLKDLGAIPKPNQSSSSLPDATEPQILSPLAGPKVVGRPLATIEAVAVRGYGDVDEIVLLDVFTSEPGELINYDEEPPYSGHYTKEVATYVEDPSSQYGVVVAESDPQDLYESVVYSSDSGGFEDADILGYSESAAPSDLYPDVIFSSEMSMEPLEVDPQYRGGMPPYPGVDYER